MYIALPIPQNSIVLACIPVLGHITRCGIPFEQRLRFHSGCMFGFVETILVAHMSMTISYSDNSFSELALM